MANATALSSSEFSALMEALGPFEPAPRLAVGVSGGADSMALAVLLHDWLRTNGGSLTALTVDHGLREGSAEEAAEAGRILAARGIEHAVLPWRDDSPQSGVQAAARSARLELLSDWCVREGVLHLALAHNAADQAETLVQRLWSGSGLDGLAAMAPLRELAQCRLLRPLIGVAPERLRATLRAAGLPWLEDPSNDDRRFGRVQARRFLAGRPNPLHSRRAAVEACHALGRWRSTMEQGCAELAAGVCRFSPLGYAELEPQPLLAAPPRMAERLLRALFQTIGGTAYAMSAEEAEGALRWVGGNHRDEAFVAGRCQLLAQQDEGKPLVLCRENRHLPKLPCRGAGPWLWDGRFLLQRTTKGEGRPFSVAPGRPAECRSWSGGHPFPGTARSALHVLLTLPWVSGAQRLPLLAHLPGITRACSAESTGVSARFRPLQPAVPGPFYGCLGGGIDTI